MNAQEIKTLMQRKLVSIVAMRKEVKSLSIRLTNMKNWLEGEVKEYEALDRKLAKLDGRFQVIPPKEEPAVQQAKESAKEKALKVFKSMTPTQQVKFLKNNGITTL